jgi:hypothetical protein
MLLEALGMQITCWHHQTSNLKGQAAANLSEYLNFRLKIVDLNFAALDRSYGELIKRHEALRATFFKLDNTIWQSINKYRKRLYELEVFDLVDTFEQDELIIEKTAGAIRVITRLHKGPLIKGLLFKIRHDQHLLICVLNDIIADAESTRILKENISSLYRHYKHGQEIPDVPDRSAEKILMKQYRHTKGQYADKDKEYWLIKLRNHVAPIDFNPFLKIYSSECRKNEKLDKGLKGLSIDLFLSNRLFNGSQVYFTDLSSKTLFRLRAISQACRVSIFSLHITAFNFLLFFFNKKNRNLIATTVNDRKLPAERNIVGHLMYKVYLSELIDGNMAACDIIRKVYLHFIQACKHPIYNESEYDHLYPDHYTDLYLNYLKMSDIRTVEVVKNIHARASNSYYALSCHIEEYDNTVGLYWHYNLDIFTPGSIEFMADMYKHIIGALEDLNIPILELQRKYTRLADTNI